LDHKINEEILEEFKVEPFDKILRRYKSNLLRHVTRMTNSRMSKIMLNCMPNGQGRLGRPLNRLLEESETGLSRSNWWRVMMMMIECVGRSLIQGC